MLTWFTFHFLNEIRLYRGLSSSLCDDVFCVYVFVLHKFI